MAGGPQAPPGPVTAGVQEMNAWSQKVSGYQGHSAVPRLKSRLCGYTSGPDGSEARRGR